MSSGAGVMTEIAWRVVGKASRRQSAPSEATLRASPIQSTTNLARPVSWKRTSTDASPRLRASPCNRVLGVLVALGKNDIS